ncbi:unnamed protein product [Urochloa humidicola]
MRRRGGSIHLAARLRDSQYGCPPALPPPDPTTRSRCPPARPPLSPSPNSASDCPAWSAVALPSFMGECESLLISQALPTTPAHGCSRLSLDLDECAVILPPAQGPEVHPAADGCP